VIYLNAAGYGPLPERTRAALNEFNDRRHRGELRDADLMSALAGARTSAARLIGCTADEIALAPNTQVALNVAANAVLERAHDRDVILISAGEFPANVYPWLALQQHGFTVELIPTDEHGWPYEEVMINRVANGDVAAVSVSFVQFASGFRADLNALSRVCRDYDTLLVVDAIQGLGAVPLDVRDTPCDLLACGGQKWLCSPWGSGFTYIRDGLVQSFEPTYPGWLSFKSSADYRSLTSYEYVFHDDARRFETGSIAFQDQLGMSISIEVLLEQGIDRIWQHLQSLQEPIIQWAAARDVEVISDLTPERRSGILCIRPPNAAAAHAALVEANVACAFREQSIRLAPHWFNTRDEINRVLAVLDAAVK
jgi:cysteine desulfurase / selenocysteine lyase